MTVQRSTEWTSIPHLVQAAGDRYGDAEAVVDGSRRVSFAQLATEVRATAAAVIAAGIEPGDRAAIWAPNRLEWIVAALGALSAGAVLVPINTRFKGDEAAYVLRKSRARLLFVSEPFAGNDYLGMLAGAELPDLALTVCLGSSAPVSSTISAEPGLSTRFAQQADARIAAARGTDTGDIIFTSGTTGRPKGVVTTHAQSLTVFDVWADVVGLEQGDRYLVVNPFFHTFGYKAGILASLMRGATVIPLATFDVNQMLEVIERERVTVLPGPPTIYQSFLDSPDRPGRDLGSLRLAVTGAAVVPVRLVERMRDELTFSTVLTAYGLTEATGTVTMCRRDDDPVTIAETSGRAIPDVEVRVVGADNQPLPAGEPGEVVCRGYNVMQGYYEDPDATAQAIDGDGWLHTGDIGVLDDRGYLRITDRLKDMYVVGGFNAYPAEIEQALARHPAIAEAAVVGVPDERLGEVGKAFVVLRTGQSLDTTALIGWCREHLANYKVPRSVEVVDALPRNASGKVLKFELRSHSLP